VKRRRTQTKSNDGSRSLTNHRKFLLDIPDLRTWRPDDGSVIAWPHDLLDQAEKHDGCDREQTACAMRGRVIARNAGYSKMN
jgi:hypothetical protein